MKRLLTLLAIAMALMLVACGGDDSGAGAGLAPKREKPTVEVPDKPPTEIAVRDIEVGDGEEVKDGATIIVDYVGVNYESGEAFENSWTNEAAKKLTMDTEEMIAGWEEGIEGMKVGGRRELLIPKEFGFGDAPLVYVVDLRGIE